jgi:hypothetical protein
MSYLASIQFASDELWIVRCLIYGDRDAVIILLEKKE